MQRRRSLKPYLFNEKELDTETGLYYYGARYYDPRVSIFLNVDPLAEKTMQPYAYANNNPVMFIDPTGMEPEDCPSCPKNNQQDRPRKAGKRPEGMSEAESLKELITIDGKKYHKNTGNLFAEIGNTINSWLGGDNDFFVEHKPYDPVDDRFIHEVFDQSAGALIGGAAGGLIKAGVGKSVGNIIKTTSKTNITSANGIKVSGFTKHGVNRAIERGVKSNHILDALKRPIKIKNIEIDKLGKQSQKFVGEKGSVVINPKTGKIITVHPTSSRMIKKLKQ